MVISETKLDDSLPDGLFKILEYVSPFPLYRKPFGGFILVFVQLYIPSKLLANYSSVETLFIKTNLREKKP